MEKHCKTRYLSKIQLAAISLCLALPSISANAGLIVNEYNWNTNASVSFNGTRVTSNFVRDVLNDTDNQITIDGFDSSLGTLDSIQIRVFGRIIGTASATFRDDDSFGGDTSGRVELQGPRFNIRGSGIDEFDNFASVTSRACSDDAFFDPTGRECTSQLVNPSWFVSTGGNITSTLFANYIDTTAMLTFNQFSALRTTQVNPDDDYISARSASLTGSGAIQVIYSYTAAPVTPPPPPITSATAPSAFGVLALGLFGMFFTRRKQTPK